METNFKPPSKLRPPSKLPTPTVKILKELDGCKPKVPTRALPLLEQRGQLRRSRSFSEIQSVMKTVPFKWSASKLARPTIKESLKQKPFVASSNIRLKKSVMVSGVSAASLQQAQKSGNPKPKTDSSNRMNPSPYGRNYLLNEQHTRVVQEQRLLEQQFDALPVIYETSTEMERLRNDVNGLNQEIVKMKAMIKTLQANNEEFFRQLKLSKKVETSTEESKLLRWDGISLTQGLNDPIEDTSEILLKSGCSILHI